jgi:ribonuclease HII
VLYTDGVAGVERSPETKRKKKSRAAQDRARVRDRARRKKKAKLKHHEALLEYERALWSQGRLAIGGLDEAGAGPLAGPIFAACVVLDPEKLDDLVGVDDSKKLREKERDELAARIRATARAWAVASASVEEIDRINILQAGLLAMRRAVDGVLTRLAPLDHLLIDARKIEIEIPITAIIKGDSKSLSIAAASILAKVERDRLMTDAASSYPDYGFERHKGYATEDHLAAVRRLGVCPLHRRSFEPISTMINQLSLF